MIPADLRAAYERGRLRDAAVQAVPVLGLFTVVLAATGGAAAQGLLAAALLAGFVALRWRGRGWGQGAMLGVIAGAVPALVAACLVAEGLGCVGAGCTSGCATMCVGAGAVGGGLLGVRAQERAALLTGVAVAALAGVLGCWPLGLGAVAGMVASLTVAAAGAQALRAGVGLR